MQITINEAEIHTAIRNHVLGLISVREDMRIDIDLKATRGSDGYTAVIDIYPDDTPSGGVPIETAPPAAKKTPAVEVAKAEPKEAAKADPKPEPKAEAEVVDKAPVAEAAEPEAPVEEAPKSTVKALFKKPVAKPAEEAPASPATESTRSIFGAMKKPVNTPAEETDAAA